MIVDDDSSLIIRGLKLKDSGTYFCAERGINGKNGRATILKVTNQTNPEPPSLMGDHGELKEKGSDTNLPIVPYKSHDTGEGLNDKNAFPLVSNGEDTEEPSGTNTWLILLIIFLVILVIIIFYCIIVYKERNSATNRNPRFSPQKKGGDSQYALKDCMEVDEDVTFIGTGQNIEDKQYDNTNNIEKEVSTAPPSPSCSTSTLQADSAEKPIGIGGKEPPSKPEEDTLPLRKTSNISKSSSLFDCDCGSSENSSAHPCFK